MAATGFVLALATSASAQMARLTLSLTPTQVNPGAIGKAHVRVKGDDGKFTVIAKRAGINATFAIVVDGVKVGTLTTSGGGNGKARFRSRPRSDRDQLLGFDPRGKRLLVRNSSGEDALVADIPAKATSGGSSDDDIRCCLSDDSGPECEDRTPAECVAQGGIDMGPGSCLPNPCAGGPVDDDVICCLPDDSGPECEDRTPAECAAQGGMVVAATSCVPNPCAAIPPVDGDIQCCLPDDSGPKCEDRTPETCTAQGGVNMGPGVCSPDPCAGLPGGGGTPAVVVTCERRSDRSRASVNGKNLATGAYTARITSGANTATAPATNTIGDEAEFDFDSEPDDIAAGATAIATTFIQGTPAQVTGEVIDSGGATVVSLTVNCRDRD
jgi:hypothetical protein